MIKAAAAQRHSDTTELLASDVGQRIRQARQERGMSLAQLGGEDLSRSFLSLVELGRSRISLRALAIVADRLQLPMSYFLEDAASSVEVVSELTMNRAEAALRSQQPAEALRLLGNADMAASQRPRALWLRGWALVDSGRSREALPVLHEALALTDPAKDGYQYIQVKYTLAMALFRGANYDEALVELRSALQRAMQEINDRALLGRITVCIGHILYVQKKFEEALAQYTRARELFDSVDDLDNLAGVYTGLSRVYEQKGDATKALRYSRLSVGIFEAKHNKRNAAQELSAMATHFRELDDLDTAVEYARKAVVWARESQASDVEAMARGTLAQTYFKLERLDDARVEAEAAEQLAHPGADLPRVDAWITLARISERSGDTSTADQLFARALDALRDSGHFALYADAAVAYSLILRERGDTNGALHYALEAAQIHSSHPA